MIAVVLYCDAEKIAFFSDKETSISFISNSDSITVEDIKNTLENYFSCYNEKVDVYFTTRYLKTVKDTKKGATIIGYMPIWI